MMFFSGLQLQIGGKNIKPGMQSLQRLVQQQWNSISNFHQTIIDVCRQKLQDVEISVEVLCNFTVCITIIIQLPWPISRSLDRVTIRVINSSAWTSSLKSGGEIKRHSTYTVLLKISSSYLAKRCKRRLSEHSKTSDPSKITITNFCNLWQIYYSTNIFADRSITGNIFERYLPPLNGFKLITILESESHLS